MHLPSASPISQTQELFLIPVSVAPDPWWRLCSSAPPPRPGPPDPRCAWVQTCLQVCNNSASKRVSFLLVSPTLNSFSTNTSIALFQCSHNLPSFFILLHVM